MLMLSATHSFPFQRKVIYRLLVFTGFAQVKPTKTKAAFQVIAPIAPPEALLISIVSHWVWDEGGGLVGALIVNAVPFVTLIVCHSPAEASGVILAE